MTPLPKSLACSASMLYKPTFLKVDLSQFTTGDSVPKASTPHQASTPTFYTHFTMEDPPKAESQISMTAEVQYLLLHTVQDTSSQALGSSTPKMLTSTALGSPSSPRVEDPSKPLDTSSQASPWVATPDITKPIDKTILPTRTLGADAGALPEEVI